MLLMVDAAVRRADQEQGQSAAGGQNRVSDKELFAKMGVKPTVIVPKHR